MLQRVLVVVLLVLACAVRPGECHQETPAWSAAPVGPGVVVRVWGGAGFRAFVVDDLGRVIAARELQTSDEAFWIEGTDARTVRVHFQRSEREVEWQ